MIKLENFLKYFFSGAIGRISQGLKNEFELAMVNEPSVFELLRFDCTLYTLSLGVTYELFCDCGFLWTASLLVSGILKLLFTRTDGIHVHQSPRQYSKNSMTRTPMARSPWMIRTRFLSPYEILPIA